MSCTSRPPAILKSFHCSAVLSSPCRFRTRASLDEELEETEDTDEERWKKKWWPAITRKCQLTFTKLFVENEKWCYLVGRPKSFSWSKMSMPRLLHLSGSGSDFTDCYRNAEFIFISDCFRYHRLRSDSSKYSGRSNTKASYVRKFYFQFMRQSPVITCVFSVYQF